MNNNLTKHEPKQSFMSWNDIRDKAEVLMKSGMLPPALNTPEKIMTVVATGRELGLDIMQSIRNIDVIQGRPAIKPRLMLAMAFDRGLIEDVKFRSSPTEAVFEVKRKGMSWHKQTFTIKQASGLGLTSRDNWRKQPDTMLLWRAISAGMNLIFPDILFGMGTPEEVGGQVQVSQADPLEAQVIQPSRTIRTPASTLPPTETQSSSQSRDAKYFQSQAVTSEPESPSTSPPSNSKRSKGISAHRNDSQEMKPEILPSEASPSESEGSETTPPMLSDTKQFNPSLAQQPSSSNRTPDDSQEPSPSSNQEGSGELPPESADSSEEHSEILSLVTDIKQKVMEMNDGDFDLAENHIKQLTTYKSKKKEDAGAEKWLAMNDLENVAKHKPAWIKGLHKKVITDWDNVFDKDGNKK